MICSLLASSAPYPLRMRYFRRSTLQDTTKLDSNLCFLHSLRNHRNKVAHCGTEQKQGCWPLPQVRQVETLARVASKDQGH
eukprot:2802427-Amphidinium_carterae.1